MESNFDVGGGGTFGEIEDVGGDSGHGRILLYLELFEAELGDFCLFDGGVFEFGGAVVGEASA